MVRRATAHRLIVMDQWRPDHWNWHIAHPLFRIVEVFRHAERWLKLHFNRIFIDFARWKVQFLLWTTAQNALIPYKVTSSEAIRTIWMHSKCTDIYLSPAFILAVWQRHKETGPNVFTWPMAKHPNAANPLNDELFFCLKCKRMS